MQSSRILLLTTLPFLLSTAVACKDEVPLLTAGIDGDTLDTVSEVNQTIRMVNATLAQGLEIGPETRSLLESVISQIDQINKGGIKLDPELLSTIRRAVEVLDRGLKVGVDDPTLAAIEHFTGVIDRQPEKWGEELQALIGVLQLAGSDLAKQVAGEVDVLRRRMVGDIGSLAQSFGQEFRCTVDYTGQQVDQTLSTAGGRLISGILAALRPGKETSWRDPIRRPGVCTILPAEIRLVAKDGQLKVADGISVAISGFNFSGENLPGVLVRDENKSVYASIHLVPALNSSYKIEIPLQEIDFTGVAPRSRVVLIFGKNTAHPTEFEKVIIPEIVSPVKAEFEGSPLQGQVPLQVQFRDRSLGGPETWLWDFGDQKQSTVNAPVHTFDRPGEFTVRLTVTNRFNTSTEEKRSFVKVVAPRPPLSVPFGEPLAGQAPLTVHFQNRSTGNPTRVRWSFGDGSATTEQDSPTHTYSVPGQFAATLTAMDAYGGSTTATLVVRAQPPPPAPVARFTIAPAQGSWPLNVSFQDRSLNTNAGTQWSWSFGDGATSTVRLPTHLYVNPGVYNVQLRVSNAYGSSTTTGMVTVLSRLGQLAQREIGPFGGPFGDWAVGFDQCPAGTLAYGFMDKVEPDQGGDDDSGLNGIKLWCVRLPNTQSNAYVTSAVQRWGAFSEPLDCGDQRSYIVGARLRIEPDLGSGKDDTGAVDVEFQCSNGRVLTNGGLDWGAWSDWRYCEVNTAICGLRTRVERDLGDGKDDTALNDVVFRCCYSK